MKLMTSEKQLISKDWGETEQGLSDVMAMLLYLIFTGRACSCLWTATQNVFREGCQNTMKIVYPMQQSICYREYLNCFFKLLIEKSHME